MILPMRRLIAPGLILLMSAVLLLAGMGTVQGQGNLPRRTPEDAVWVRLRLRRAVFDPRQAEPPPTAAGLSTTIPRPDGVAYRLVQFDGPVGPRERAALLATGAEIVSYVPDYAYLVRTDAQIRARIAGLGQLRWTGSYRPDYKLDAELETALGQGGAELPILIRLFPGEEVQPVAEQARAHGAREIQTFSAPSGALLRIGQGGIAALPELLRLEAVRWAEVDPPEQLFNDVARDLMGAPAVWNGAGLYGSGQIIAVADSGLDTGTTGAGMNDDFEGRIVAGYSLCDGRTDWSDPNGHGTHVAGSVLGSGLNSGSNPANHDYANSFAGVAPEASLIFQSTLDDQGGLGCIPADYAQMFDRAYTAGARLHTNSWGTSKTEGKYTLGSQTTDQYLWDHPAMTILFAVGNDATDGDHDGKIDPISVLSPSTAKNVIAVGASESRRAEGGYANDPYGNLWPTDFTAQPVWGDFPADNPEGLAAFSSRGPTDDGRIRPDLVAPGTNIVSVRSSASGAGTGWGVYNSNYVYMGGTSMATPLTAGAATVAREWLVEDRNIAQPSGALVKALLINGATDLSPGQYGSGAWREIASLPDNNQGWGRVNLGDSLQPAGARKVWVEDHTAGLQSGDAVTYTFSLQGSAHLAVATPAGIAPSTPLTETLTNGGFETGNWSPWQIHNQSTLVSNPTHNGSYAARMGGHGYIDGQGDQIFQPIAFPSSAVTATMHFWYDLDSTQILAGLDQFIVGVWNSSGDTKLVTIANIDGIETTSGWTQLTYAFTASDLTQVRGQDVQVGFIVTNNNFNYTTVYLDDVSLEVGSGTPPTPTEGALVFVKGADLWRMDTDGGNAQRWHTGIGGGADFPRWSPDGSRIAYTDNGAAWLVVEGLDGDRHLVDKTAGISNFFYSPTWSPDGARLLFSKGNWAGTSIYVMNADGTGSAQDLTPTWGGTSPDWSPDGAKIAYKGYQGKLYLMDADGSNKQALTTDDAWDPRWSPDGALIGLIYINGSAQNCFATITPAGTNLTDRLCSSSANLWEPTWSPDGQQVILEIQDVGGTNLWRYDLPSDTTEQLTTDGQSTLPDWRWQDPPPPQEPPGVAGSLRFTLVWTDYPGAPENAIQLVNDLDIEVIAPNDAHYHGNGGSTPDRRNPVEDVYLTLPQTGDYQVIVRGYQVPLGPQPYALVASGDNLTLKDSEGSKYHVYLPLVHK